MAVCIIAALIGMLLAVWLIFGLEPFRRELKRINIEIERTTGEEQKMWLALRRKLWLSLIPFIKY